MEGDGLRARRDRGEVRAGGLEIAPRRTRADIPEHPATDDAVVRQRPEAAEDAESSDDTPPRPVECIEGTDSADVGTAADDELREYRRYSNDENRDQIHQ
jgi:hypothetical protein